MKSVQPEFKFPKEIIEEFVKTKKFEKRYTSLLSDMLEYISKSECTDKVFVNEMVLGYAIIDYFEDIRRLKKFHGVDHINSIKIVSYTAYWLLRRKPIQIKELDKELLYINEYFVLAYILDFLEYSKNDKILNRTGNDGLISFAEQLLYHLKYRTIDAKSLEMLIMAFFAGQIYQEKDKDMSSLLPEHDTKED